MRTVAVRVEGISEMTLYYIVEEFVVILTFCLKVDTCACHTCRMVFRNDPLKVVGVVDIFGMLHQMLMGWTIVQ